MPRRSVSAALESNGQARAPLADPTDAKLNVSLHESRHCMSVVIRDFAVRTTGGTVCMPCNRLHVNTQNLRYLLACRHRAIIHSSRESARIRCARYAHTPREARTPVATLLTNVHERSLEDVVRTLLCVTCAPVTRGTAMKQSHSCLCAVMRGPHDAHGRCPRACHPSQRARMTSCRLPRRISSRPGPAR